MRAEENGFTLVEALVAGVLLGFALLAMSGMFVTGYANVAVAGNTTTGLAAARHALEEMRVLPFASVVALDGFDTDDAASLPADDPEREFARRWRYMMAGAGVGWSFSGEELARWPQPAGDLGAAGASGRIDVVLENPNLARVHVFVAIPGSWRNIELSTLVSGN